MLTPKGLEVNRLVSLMASLNASGLGCVKAVKIPVIRPPISQKPMVFPGYYEPRAPAFETAATKGGKPTLLDDYIRSEGFCRVGSIRTIAFHPVLWDCSQGPLEFRFRDEITKSLYTRIPRALVSAVFNIL